MHARQDPQQARDALTEQCAAGGDRLNSQAGALAQFLQHRRRVAAPEVSSVLALRKWTEVPGSNRAGSPDMALSADNVHQAEIVDHRVSELVGVEDVFDGFEANGDVEGVD
jgi:hypothetical protein